MKVLRNLWKRLDSILFNKIFSLRTRKICEIFTLFLLSENLVLSLESWVLREQSDPYLHAVLIVLRTVRQNIVKTLPSLVPGGHLLGTAEKPYLAFAFFIL